MKVCIFWCLLSVAFVIGDDGSYNYQFGNDAGERGASYAKVAISLAGGADNRADGYTTSSASRRSSFGHSNYLTSRSGYGGQNLVATRVVKVSQPVVQKRVKIVRVVSPVVQPAPVVRYVNVPAEPRQTRVYSAPTQRTYGGALTRIQESSESSESAEETSSGFPSYHTVASAPVAARYVTVRQQESSEEQSYAPANYNFQIAVQDDDTQVYNERQENQDNGVLSGFYRYVRPDGVLQTVHYSDNGNGLQANVQEEDQNVFSNFRVDAAPTSGYETRPSAPVLIQEARAASPVYVQEARAAQPVYVHQESGESSPVFVQEARVAAHRYSTPVVRVIQRNLSY